LGARALPTDRRQTDGRATAYSERALTRGIAKYSDFGLILGYISETVQDRK